MGIVRIRFLSYNVRGASLRYDKSRGKPGFHYVLWRACGDSNARPSAPEADTLSAELQAQTEPQKAKPILPSKEDGVKAEKIVCAKVQRSLEPSLKPPADAQNVSFIRCRRLTFRGGSLQTSRCCCMRHQRLNVTIVTPYPPSPASPRR